MPAPTTTERPPVAPPRPRVLTTGRAVLAATLLAAVACLVRLGSQPLSWDEAVTASAATRPYGHLFALLGHTDAPLGPYYLLMHQWVRLPGLVHLTATDAWLRLPSALAAIGAVALAALLASRWFGARAGLLAGVLLAVHPVFVYYAHDARPYTLVALLVLVTTWQFTRALARPTAGRLACYAVLATATIYLHLFAALALVAQFGLVALRREKLPRWAVTGVVIGAVSAPFVLHSSGQTHEIGWIPAATLGSVSSVLAKLYGGPLVLLPLLVLAIVAAVRYRRRPGATMLFVLASAVLPPLLLVLANFAQPVLVTRYLLYALPFALIAVAAGARGLGLGRGPWRVAAGLVVVAVAASVVSSGVQQTRPYKYGDFRAAARTVTETARPGDGLVFLPTSTRVGFERYAGTGALPADVARLPGTSVDRSDTLGGVEAAPGDLGALISARDRVYLVGDQLPFALDNRKGEPDLAKEHPLVTGYHQVWTRNYGAVSVTLFVRN